MSAQMPGWTRPDRGALFVVSGPSGVGKSTLVRRALSEIPDLQFSVSATTRAARPGEVDGVHYHFVSPDRFAEMVRDGAFLEHATVYDRRYGTLAGPTEEVLATGRSLVLDVDVQGARQIRERMPEAVHIFVAPPSRGALEARLRGRGSESEARIAGRMAQATEQLEGCPQYDYILVNDVVEVAHRAFQGILLAELSRVERRPQLVERLSTLE